ncbi:unnamed protein product [marine sediment metagenome]|uniref:Uncharacterized protein n=1 Tax=marine sediment metagenome TaxID=412755 RepID=X0Z9F0_9ZZZZ
MTAGKRKSILRPVPSIEEISDPERADPDPRPMTEFELARLVDKFLYNVYLTLEERYGER